MGANTLKKPTGVISHHCRRDPDGPIHILCSPGAGGGDMHEEYDTPLVTSTTLPGVVTTPACEGHDALLDSLLSEDMLNDDICSEEHSAPDSLRTEKLCMNTHWFSHPYISHRAPGDIALIYDVVVSQKATNSRGARIPLPTSLNLQAWERESTGHDDDALVMQRVAYGFSLQYLCGPIYNDGTHPPNHHSAHHYPAAIKTYIDKERALGTLIGPFDTPPFIPWCHVSPLMSRPKSDSDKRRITVDISCPDGGINAHIP